MLAAAKILYLLTSSCDAVTPNAYSCWITLFSLTSNPNATCNIEGFDATTLVTTFATKAEWREWENGGDIWDNNVKSVSLRDSNNESLSRTGYSCLSVGSCLISFFILFATFSVRMSSSSSQEETNFNLTYEDFSECLNWLLVLVVLWLWSCSIQKSPYTNLLLILWAILGYLN